MSRPRASFWKNKEAMYSAATKHLPSPPEQVLKSFINITLWQAHWSTMISESELLQKAPAEVYQSLKGVLFIYFLSFFFTAALIQNCSILSKGNGDECWKPYTIKIGKTNELFKTAKLHQFYFVSEIIAVCWIFFHVFHTISVKLQNWD